MSSNASTGARPSSAAILGEDGKLSSASAATSLKYAKAQDLPSFPSTGGVQLSSAGAAASLANSNRKSFEHWKPEPIPAANKAAMLSQGYTVGPMYEPPELSAAGSRAALMAHANPTHIEPMQPKKPATNASKPSAAYDTPEDTHKKALMAATAVSRNRQRSGSAPIKPASEPAGQAGWAMKAATSSTRKKPAAAPTPPRDPSAFASGDPGFEAARIQNAAKNNVDRQLYTSAPPVAIEVQEKNRQDTLRASAIAMAQKMYAIQQKQIDEAAGKDNSHALAASRARSSTVTGSSDSASGGGARASMGYENLEEAARKLAQERLAKIHDEHAEYRSYYGQTSPSRSRLSMRMSRGRASSAADDDDSDEEQSRKIRSQMSIFTSKLAEVDSKKRRSDRDKLLEIAHRNVDKQMTGMDEKVFQDTGKASPAQMEKWQKSAREKAQADSDVRMQHAGKVHIGGGKYLDQSELDAIARTRLQPTLDDISAKAEAHRAKDEEERLDRERKQQQTERDNRRAAETTALVKAQEEKAKQGAQATKDEERRVRKEEEAAEKSRRDEERRAQKEGQNVEKERQRQKAAAEKDSKRMSKDTKPGRFTSLLGRGGTTTAAETEPAATITTVETTRETTSVPVTSNPVTTAPAITAPDTTELTTVATSVSGPTIHDQVTSSTAESATPVVTKLEPVSPPAVHAQVTTTTGAVPTVISEDPKASEEATEEVASPTKSRGLGGWMKDTFGSKSSTQKAAEPTGGSVNRTITMESEKSIEPKDPVHRTNSERDVAMAGRTSTQETNDMYGSAREVSPGRTRAVATGGDRSPSISSLSSDDLESNKPNTNLSLGTTKTPTEDEIEQRGRSGRTRRLLTKLKPGKEKPKEEPATKVVSNTTDDEFEEARDEFEEEKLAPPPPLSVVTGEGSGTKTRSPKGSRERSKFTEDL